MSWEEKPGPGPGIILSNKYRSDGCYTFPEEPLKSYYKNLTLQKNYGSTGSVETVDGAFYIGMVVCGTFRGQLHLSDQPLR